MAKGNGAMLKFEPTHRTRLQYVSAIQVKIKRPVETDDGKRTADVGDYVVTFGNGKSTVLQQAFFEFWFEQLKTEKESENE